MKIPFKLKSRAFRVLSHLPEGALYFAQRHITRRSRVHIDEIHRGWLYHAESVRNSGAKSLIEFGAGKTLAQNLYLSQYLDNQTVVDLFPMMELPMLNQAIQQLRELGVPLDPREITSLAMLQDVHNIRYIAPFDMTDTGLPDGSFDICISTNTLEHIPRASIEAIFAELSRIIAWGGQISAMIDYSDHYAHSDKSITRLHYLQFSDADYKVHNHDNHYQNRMRHDHYRAIFESTGFQTLEEGPVDICDPAGLDLRDDMLTGNEDDFATTGFWRLAKQKEAEF